MHTVNAANIPSARTGGMKLKKLLPNATAVVSDVASMALAAGAYRAAKTSSEGSKIPSSSPQSSLMAALNASNISMASSHPIPMSTKGTSMLRKDTYGDADAALEEAVAAFRKITARREATLRFQQADAHFLGANAFQLAAMAAMVASLGRLATTRST